MILPNKNILFRWARMTSGYKSALPFAQRSLAKRSFA